MYLVLHCNSTVLRKRTNIPSVPRGPNVIELLISYKRILYSAVLRLCRVAQLMANQNSVHALNPLTTYAVYV
jgi:hypothetical protein